MVAHVLPNGPLAAAGVQVNDVVLAVAGTDLSTMALTPAGVSASDGLPGLKHGTPVGLRLRRDGAERELMVVPSRLPNPALPAVLGLKVLRDQGWFRDGDVTTELPEADGCLAQEVRALALKLRQHGWLGLDRLQIIETEKGADLHVLKLDPAGPVAAAGFQEGDVILAIDRIDISTMPFRRAGVAIRQIFDGLRPGRPLHFRLRRGDSEVEIELTPPILRGYPLAGLLGSRLLRTAKIFYDDDVPDPSQLRPPTNASGR